MIRLSGPRRPRMPAAPAAGGAPGTAPPVPASTLDARAIERLHELDPSGTQGVVERVLRAYHNALTRQIEEIEAARDAGEADRLSRLAHTLKSSSASVGALRLSQLCAGVERALRTQPPAALRPELEALIHEARQVLAAVRAILTP